MATSSLDSGAASNRGGEILSLGNAEFKLASLDNAGGKVHSDGKLELQAQGDILNQQGVFSTLQQLELHSRDGKIASQGGKLQAGATLNASAKLLDNSQGGVIDGGGKLTLNSAGQLGNDGGRIHGGAAVELQAGGLGNAGGALESKTTLTLKVDGALDNHGGKLLSEQAQSLQAGDLNNDQGSIGVPRRLDAGQRRRQQPRRRIPLAWAMPNSNWPAWTMPAASCTATASWS